MGLGTLRYMDLRSIPRLGRMKFPDTREGRVQAAIAIARFCASPVEPFDEEEARVRAERLVDAGTRDNHAQSQQIGAQWHGPAISTVTAPTLVLHGQDDPLIRPRAAEAIASRVPGARLITLPGVGHDIPGSIRRTLAARIRELADHAAGAAESR